MPTINIPPEDFRRWIDQQAEKGRVFRPVFGPIGSGFYSSWCCGCPLATYAREVLGFPKAAWTGDRLIPDCTIARLDLIANEWTSMFVRRVDRDHHGEISALIASAILYDMFDAHDAAKA